MGVNPNRISSPFGGTKTVAARLLLAQSAQVSGWRRVRRRNPIQPDARPAGPSMGHHARLEAFGQLQEQMGRAWAADAAALDEIGGRESEATRWDAFIAR